MNRRHLCTAALAASAISVHGLGATINVPADQPTIQDAVDAASNGDVIVVAPGTWAGFSAGVFDDLTIRSQDPGDPDIVLATVVESTVQLGLLSGLGLRVEGMSFTNAGIVALESTITLENCSFAGARINGQEVLLTANNCVFTNANQPPPGFIGGAILVQFGANSVSLIDCAFYQNRWIGSGGAVSMLQGDSLVIDRCIFSGNFAAADQGAGGFGGAVSAVALGSIEIRNSTFCGNSAVGGGGAIVAEAENDVLLEGCVITGNSSGDVAGGAFLATTSGSVELRRSVVQANTAAGVGGGVLGDFTATGGISTICGNIPDQISGTATGMLRVGEICPPPGFLECLPDLDGDGMVGFTDLTTLLAAWGPCPG